MKKKISHSIGFEPMLPVGTAFQVQRVNHSANCANNVYRF